MNHLQIGSPTQGYRAAINTGQPMAAASSQPQHFHPTELTSASLSLSAHRLLDQVETQGNNSHQLMALLVRNSVIDGTMTLQSRQDAHAHYAQEVNIPGEIDKALLTVRVRLNEGSQYDIAGIDLRSRLWSRKESFEAPAAQLPDQAARYARARRPSSAFPHDGSAPLPGPARTQLGSIHSSPYANASQSPGSRPTTIQMGRCKHNPGGVISTETFVGCNDTDDELERGDKNPKQRIRSRRSVHNQAQARGLKSTAELRKKDGDERAHKRGFPDRNAALLAERDKRASRKGFSNRHKAAAKERDKRAVELGYLDGNDAQRARRAAAKAAIEAKNV